MAVVQNMYPSYTQTTFYGLILEDIIMVVMMDIMVEDKKTIIAIIIIIIFLKININQQQAEIMVNKQLK